jgi:hypothetical protein
MARLLPSVAIAGLLVVSVACNQVPFENQPGKPEAEKLTNITKPIPKQPDVKKKPVDLREIWPGSSWKAVWMNRCGECHDYKRGVGKYHGEDWIPIVDRMIKKEGAHLTADMARHVFLYLADATRLPDDKSDYLAKYGTEQDKIDYALEKKAAEEAAKNKHHAQSAGAKTKK